MEDSLKHISEMQSPTTNWTEVLTSMQIDSSLVISILALLFTLYSFWWMNWRKGKLRVSYIKHYGIHNSVNKLYLELPLVFFNTGAMPVIIESLRLVLLDKDGIQKHLHFNAIRTELGENKGRYVATPFSINKGDSKKIVCEFQKNPSEVVFHRGNYLLILEAKYYHSKNWKKLKTFEISIPEEKLENIKNNYEILEELK